MQHQFKLNQHNHTDQKTNTSSFRFSLIEQKLIIKHFLHQNSTPSRTYIPSITIVETSHTSPTNLIVETSHKGLTNLIVETIHNLPSAQIIKNDPKKRRDK